jgi:hypothetical protein
MRASVVRDGMKEANLALARTKFKHFPWWLGGKQ